MIHDDHKAARTFKTGDRFNSVAPSTKSIDVQGRLALRVGRVRVFTDRDYGTLIGTNERDRELGKLPLGAVDPRSGLLAIFLCNYPYGPRL